MLMRCHLVVPFQLPDGAVISFERNIHLPFAPYPELVFLGVAKGRTLEVTETAWSVAKQCFEVSFDYEDLGLGEPSAESVLGPEWSRVVYED